MTNPVVHWEIGAKDAAKMGAFYGELFGWRIDHNTALNYRMVDTGGAGIGGGIFQTDQKTMPPYVTFYIQVDDLQAYLDKAQQLGGKTIVPPMPIPNMGAMAMFADPEGHVIGLFKTA